MWVKFISSRRVPGAERVDNPSRKALSLVSPKVTTANWSSSSNDEALSVIAEPNGLTEATYTQQRTMISGVSEEGDMARFSCMRHVSFVAG